MIHALMYIFNSLPQGASLETDKWYAIFFMIQEGHGQWARGLPCKQNEGFKNVKYHKDSCLTVSVE